MPTEAFTEEELEQIKARALESAQNCAREWMRPYLKLADSVDTLLWHIRQAKRTTSRLEE